MSIRIRIVPSYAEGRVKLDLNDLIRLFGNGPVEDVPTSAMSAEVIVKKNDVVKIMWTCVATEEQFRKMAPELAKKEDRGRNAANDNTSHFSS